MQACDYCDANEPGKAHPAIFAVDGSERWWQSRPLSSGLQYEKVNLTIDLGQVSLSNSSPLLQPLCQISCFPLENLETATNS